MRQKIARGVLGPSSLPAVASVAAGSTFTVTPTGVVYMRLSDKKPSCPKGEKDPNELFPPVRINFDRKTGVERIDRLVACATIGTGKLVYFAPEKEVYPVRAEVLIESEWGQPNVTDFGRED